MSSPEQEFLRLKAVQGHVSEAAVEKIFNQLKPIVPSTLLGKWEGGDFDTGHAAHKQLSEMRWAGKEFRSVNDGDPIVVFDSEGKRVWNKSWGHCTIREMVYRGIASATMIYDEKPIFDHFRYVNKDVVAGAMDAPKTFGTESTYYFYLVRLG